MSEMTIFSMERWIGRVALVTGASAGIGAAICKALVKEGVIVVGCARNVKKIKKLVNDIEVKAPGKLHAIKCDLGKESDIIKMFEEIRSEFGRLDICINNAAFSINSPLLTGNSSEWRSMLEVNILALCICTREAVKLIREKDSAEGQIIHIGSMGGHKFPDPSMPGFNFYCGTKSMVKGLTEGLRQEIMVENTAENFIRVASVSPGLTQTEFLSRSLNPVTALMVYASTTCLSPMDIADAVLYILKSPPTVNVYDILVVPTEKEA